MYVLAVVVKEKKMKSLFFVLLFSIVAIASIGSNSATFPSNAETDKGLITADFIDVNYVMVNVDNDNQGVLPIFDISLWKCKKPASVFSSSKSEVKPISLNVVSTIQFLRCDLYKKEQESYCNMNSWKVDLCKNKIKKYTLKHVNSWKVTKTINHT